MARIIKDTIKADAVVDWPTCDFNELSFPARRSTTSRAKPQPKLWTSATSSVSGVPDDDHLDEDYVPNTSGHSKVPKKKLSGASRRAKATEKILKKVQGSRKVGMTVIVGGRRTGKPSPRITLPDIKLPILTAALTVSIEQSHRAPMRTRKPPDKYYGISPAVRKMHHSEEYYPDVSPPLTPHLDTVWDDSAKDYMFIASSRIQRPGQGAFASRRSADGVNIRSYKGCERLKLRDVLRASYKLDYVWTDETSGIVRVAQDPLSCTARYINDAIDAKKDSCQCMVIRNQVCRVTLRRIEENEELYASYGEMYWRHSR
jgi:hypothetical protein